MKRLNNENFNPIDANNCDSRMKEIKIFYDVLLNLNEMPSHSK